MCRRVLEAAWKKNSLIGVTHIGQGGSGSTDTGSKQHYPLNPAQVSVGMLTASGPCYGWAIDHSPGSLQLEYGTLAYSGPAADLASAISNGRSLAAQSVSASDCTLLPWWDSLSIDVIISSQSC